MTDISDSHDEPARDVRLGAMMRAAIGGTPHGDVDWSALAARIGDRLPMQVVAPWWTYAARWERRVIPLALAAGIAGAAALWGTATAGTANASTTDDLLVQVASGAPVEEAARLYSRTFTGTSDRTAVQPE